MGPEASAAEDLLCLTLRDPRRVVALSAPGSELLVRQARRAGLLARIGCMLDAQGSLDEAAAAPKAHLRSAMALAEAQHAQALRELTLIDQALAPTGIQPVLLKDAAYVTAGMLPAMGRQITAIDVLVPESRLAEAQTALMSHGWGTATHHGIGLRLHHAVLPTTARWMPDPARLLAAAARPLAGWQCVAVLDAPDMVLVGMAHLFRNDDPCHSLRDLSDIDLLLRHQGRATAFWTNLVARARELELDRPLYLGLRHAALRLGTPVPRNTVLSVAAHAPGPLAGRLSDMLWAHALRPRHVTAHGAWTPLALWALSLRAPWWRAPPVQALHRSMPECRQSPAIRALTSA